MKLFDLFELFFFELFFLHPGKKNQSKKNIQRPTMSRRRRRRFTKKSTGLAKKALKEVRKLKRMVKPEVKIFDLGTTEINPNIAGIIAPLLNIAGGNTSATRDGVVIRPVWFTLRWSMIQDGAATRTNVRCIVVRDKIQEQATIPAVLDVLKIADVLSPYGNLIRGRFQKFYDVTVNMDQVLRQSFVSRRLTRTLKFGETKYIGAAATDIFKNGMYIIFLSTLNATLPQVRWNAQMYFTDV